MNGYEKQWNSSDMLGLGKVQLGDARALNSEVKDYSRLEKQRHRLEERCYGTAYEKNSHVQKRH